MERPVEAKVKEGSSLTVEDAVKTLRTLAEKVVGGTAVSGGGGVESVNSCLKFLPNLYEAANRPPGLDRLALEVLERSPGGNAFAHETKLLASTAWARMTIVYAGAEGGNVSGADASAVEARKRMLLEIENQATPTTTAPPSPERVPQLVSGILNSGSDPTLRDANFLTDLLRHILIGCNGAGSHSYAGFQAFRLWTRRLTELLESDPDTGFFDQGRPERLLLYNSELMQIALQTVLGNWENPVKGVPDLMLECFSNLLDAWQVLHKGAGSTGAPSFDDILTELLDANLERLSWKTKAKYPPLEALIPRVGVALLLEKCPDLGAGMAQCLTSNTLASAGTAVYKVLLGLMSGEQWTRTFLPHLMGRNDPDDPVGCCSIVRNNLINHWLPATIKTGSGGSGVTLLAELLQERNRLRSTVDSASLDLEGRRAALRREGGVWLATLTVLKVMKKTTGDETQLVVDFDRLAEEAIFHGLPAVRVAAFSLLCNVKKKSVPPSREEMRLIKAFIRQNLTVDSAAFRQEFVSAFTIFIIRCRDCLVPELRKCRRAVSGAAEVRGLQLDGKLVLLQDVDEIMRTLFDNLFPGANYQRLATSLELLRRLHSCFFCFERDKGMNKWSSNADPTELVLFAQEHGLLQFCHSNNAQTLLVAGVFHYMEDVRRLASDLLIGGFEGSPFASASSSSSSSTTYPPLTDKAVQLVVGSPKFAECDGGAILLKLLLVWTSESGNRRKECLARGLASALESYLDKAGVRAAGLGSTTKLGPVLVSEILLEAYKGLLGSTRKDDLLRLAQRAPMHGILTSIRICLETDLKSLCPENYEWLGVNFVDSLIDTILSGVNIMLEILSGDSGSGSASFEDMGMAIDNLIGRDGWLADDEDEVAISDDHSLVLACLWLNLKEASLLAATLVKVCPQEVVTVPRVRKCGRVLEMVLTRCRHKGAMESASAALYQFAQHCYNDRSELALVPGELLDTCLRSIDAGGPAISSSVTRRSAGLPMLVRQILAANSDRELLRPTVDRLVRIAAPAADVVTPSPDAAETRDSPQVCALHILKALVHESRLSHDIGPLLTPVVGCCLVNFGSDVWAVCNAALQLFGAIVPRILGQKKVRGSEEFSNSVLTAPEFLTRFPEMGHLLLAHLVRDRQVDGPSRKSQLVPLLAMLSRLSPGLAVANDPAAHMAAFRQAFWSLMSSPVYCIRAMAATAYVNFTDVDNMEPELGRVVRLLLAGPPANLAHSLLMVTSEVIQRVKLPGALAALARKVGLHQLRTSPIFDGPCYFLKVLLFRLLKDVEIQTGGDQQLCPGDHHQAPDRHELCHHHPGYKDWLDEVTVNDDHALGQAMDGARAVLSKLEDILASGVAMDGRSAAVLNRTLQIHSGQVFEDPELAIDLLDLYSRLAAAEEGQQVGLTARTGILVSQIICLSSMLSQPDFGMFFGDGSTYLAQLSEATHQLECLAAPSNVVDSRMDVARAVDFLLRALRIRKLSSETKFHPLLQYALVKLLNATLILLVDEDPVVREAAALAVGSNLVGTTFCTIDLAMETLVTYGLQEFSECAEWFSPVLKVFYTPWVKEGRGKNVGDVEDESSKLFKNGEGLNVYAEPSAINAKYASILRKYLTGLSSQLTGPPFKLNIDLDLVMEGLQACPGYPFEDYRTLSLDFCCLMSSTKYLAIMRYYNLLVLTEEFPEVTTSKKALGSELKGRLSVEIQRLRNILPLGLDNATSELHL